MSDLAEDPPAIDIVLADDHEVVRAGLRLLLQGQEGLHVIGEAGNVPDALRLVEQRRPHVLVLDLNMPGPSSLTAIAEVKATCAVVVLTMQSDPAFAREALRAGARAYVLKEAAGAELVTAIRTVARGGTYLNPQMGARMALELTAAAAAAPDDLSERELEVLRLIALGHTNAEIGERLFLSMRTVETHRSHIQHKLRRTTRAELVRYALDHGLIDA
ncbi:response regulator transcription factor [Solirubrobacter ginsenosidimutans]|uniref:Response regulator transcription factor n=1 Tax=Solirubrobacter ginsenosidimutans TaxID=490573 RepID=A0A9X3MUH8_9ACTN|nr:response regulator transcription factor [Solirubrobacter ginsenosidimutans]MDA0163236.1 response regulator transcription factor [Solirubrobacter ginsenosidimutans]